MQRVDIKERLKNCDLIIDVTNYGADPSGKQDSTEAIWQAFESAKNRQGLVVIDFPQGTYQLQKSLAQQRIFHTSNTDSIAFPEKRVALLLEDQKNVIVNGNGSLLLIHGDCTAFAVIRSKNIHLYNFAWDYAVPTVIEMTVTGVGEEDGEQYTDYIVPSCFTFSVDDHGENLTWYSEKDPNTEDYYWTDSRHMGAGALVVYHPDRNFTRRYDLNVGPFSNRKTRIARLSETKLRIYYGEERPFIHQKGIVFSFCSIPNRETAGAFIWESQEIVIEKVNVHYLHAFGWLTQMCHNVTYLDCMFKAREGTGRHVTSYADLIHVSGASGHIHIEGCEFYHPHDDPINIHGTFTRVEERVDENRMKLCYVHRQQGGFPQFYEGNEVVFYRRDTLTPALGNEKRYTVAEVKHPGENGNDLRTMVVTFEQSLPDELFERIDGEPLIVAENVTFTPSVHIKNNHFEQVPTRGILCSTRQKVLIEDNTFKHMAMDAIFISNDSQDWYESGPVRDVRIRNNTFYVAKVGDAPWKTLAIRVLPVTKGYQYPHFEQAIHQNIKIDNNQFFLEHEGVITATSVMKLHFKENYIGFYQPEIDQRYNRTILERSEERENSRNTFEFTACDGVVLKQNRYENGYEPTFAYSKMPENNIKVED